ncbi:MAG: hypothetical protein JNL70_00910 [Saprospiraceae bacterium]|nr:hypothetical protein [Saprospiraceae bacterium]
MTQDQSSKYDMYQRAIKLCNDNPDIVALNPAFKEDKEVLEALLPTMNQLSKSINAGNAHAVNKKNIKDKMIEAGLDVCTNLKGYGKKVGDEAIIKMSDYSKTSLCKGKENEVLERCQTIADKARELLSELIAKRGMKKALLMTFEDLIQQYNDIKPEPRSAVQERSTLIEKLNAEFKKADEAFALMVSSAVNMKGEADDFLKRFEKAIVIIAPKTSATKINFVVENSVTKENIVEYKVESDIINVTRTPTAARSLVMSLPPQKKAQKGQKGEKKEKKAGTDFTITSDGFEPVVLTAQKIKRGKINTIKVAMVPISAM